MIAEYLNNIDRFTNRSMLFTTQQTKEKNEFSNIETEVKQLGLIDLFDYCYLDQQQTDIDFSFILRVFSRLAYKNDEITFFLSRHLQDHISATLLDIKFDPALETISLFPDSSFTFSSGQDFLVLDYGVQGLDIYKANTTDDTAVYSGFQSLTFLKNLKLNLKQSNQKISPDLYIKTLAIHSLIYQAIYLGILSTSIQYAHQYASTRYAFGKPIINFQAISQKLARLCIKFESLKTHLFSNTPSIHSENLLQHALEGERLCFQAGPEILQESVQCLGGHGYVSDHPVEKWFRNSVTLLGFIQEISNVLRRHNDDNRR